MPAESPSSPEKRCILFGKRFIVWSDRCARRERFSPAFKREKKVISGHARSDRNLHGNPGALTQS